MSRNYHCTEPYLCLVTHSYSDEVVLGRIHNFAVLFIHAWRYVMMIAMTILTEGRSCLLVLIEKSRARRRVDPIQVNYTSFL